MFAQEYVNFDIGGYESAWNSYCDDIDPLHLPREVIPRRRDSDVFLPLFSAKTLDVSENTMDADDASESLGMSTDLALHVETMESLWPYNHVMFDNHHEANVLDRATTTAPATTVFGMDVDGSFSDTFNEAEVAHRQQQQHQNDPMEVAKEEDVIEAPRVVEPRRSSRPPKPNKSRFVEIDNNDDKEDKEDAPDARIPYFIKKPKSSVKRDQAPYQPILAPETRRSSRPHKPNSFRAFTVGALRLKKTSKKVKTNKKTEDTVVPFTSVFTIPSPRNATEERAPQTIPIVEVGAKVEHTVPPPRFPNPFVTAITAPLLPPIQLAANEEWTVLYPSEDEKRFAQEVRSKIEHSHHSWVIDAFLYCMVHRHGGHVLAWADHRVEFKLVDVRETLCIINLATDKPLDRQSIRDTWRSLRFWFDMVVGPDGVAPSIRNCSGLTLTRKDAKMRYRGLLEAAKRIGVTKQLGFANSIIEFTQRIAAFPHSEAQH